MHIRDCFAVAMLASGVLAASPMASDYLTQGNDPGRTGWMKDEKVFSLANDQVPAVGKEPVGRVRPRVRGDAGRHGLRFRVCDGAALVGTHRQIPSSKSQISAHS